MTAQPNASARVFIRSVGLFTLILGLLQKDGVPVIRNLKMSHLLIGEGLLWAALCCYFNGPAILAYIALHVVTTGVFLGMLLMVMRSQSARPQLQPIAGQSPGPEPASEAARENSRPSAKPVAKTMPSREREPAFSA